MYCKKPQESTGGGYEIPGKHRNFTVASGLLFL